MNRVKKLYAILNARWYDLFKKAWNAMVASKAEKQLSLFLEKNLDETQKILELGCGTAVNLEKIFSLDLRFKKYLGLDFSPAMLNIARKKFSRFSNISFQEYDITHLNERDEIFDIIICTWVLSHLEHPAKLVNEAQKLLAKDGKIFLIFMSKPAWYVHFWFYLLAKTLFAARCVSNEEIKKMKNIKKKNSMSAHLVTTIEITNP